MRWLYLLVNSQHRRPLMRSRRPFLGKRSPRKLREKAMLLVMDVCLSTNEYSPCDLPWTFFKLQTHTITPSPIQPFHSLTLTTWATRPVQNVHLAPLPGPVKICSLCSLYIDWWVVGPRLKILLVLENFLPMYVGNNGFNNFPFSLLLLSSR